VTDAAPRVAATHLAEFLTALYTAAGLPAADAAIVAAQTLDAELRGIASHGVVRVGVFIERLRRGTVNPAPDVRTMLELPGWALLDGDRGMSAVVGRRAMDVAIAKAAANGIGAAGVRRVSHTGHVGWFAAMASSHDMIGVVASSAAANLAPWGGAERIIGNNPIAFAIPSGGGDPVVLDMATSQVARGYVLLAAKTGASIPEGWALDADGRPTTDAHRAVEGTLLPMGEHKGAGLAFVLELLTNALTGNPLAAEELDWLDPDREFLLSMLCIAIDPRRCLGTDHAAVVRAMVERVRSSRPAAGSDEVRVPGDASARRAREARAHGIALAPALVVELERLAAELGVAPLRNDASQFLKAKFD
jgi:LDH2 family malate/lactate/ureidoglycolate dehydrogenase